MMDSEKIRNEITEKQKTREIVKRDIAEKQIELDERRDAYSRGLLSNADKEKKPQSLSVQKRRVMEAETEYNALVGAKTLLDREVEGLENELQLAELYQSAGQRYTTSRNEAAQLSADLTALAGKIAESVESFDEVSQRLMDSVSNARGGLKAISKRLDQGLSMEAFVNGEVETIEEPDHDAVLEKAGSELRQIALTPTLEVELIEVLLQRVRQFNDWRRRILASDGSGLILSKRALRPSKPKTIPIDGESRRAGKDVREQVKGREKELQDRFKSAIHG